MTNYYQSWGRYPKTSQRVQKLYWRTDDWARAIVGNLSCLPFGNGRSYGDSCLNHDGLLLDISCLNRYISFDPEKGLLCCEAGVRLGEILELVMPYGYFLPVTPGTKYVSVGGAIANDVHGKNHHCRGSFGSHVLKFELARSNGERWMCTREERPDWFNATVGGLGLTGVILWAELQLVKIPSPYMDAEVLCFYDFDEFLKLSHESDAKFEYTVAWLDAACFQNNVVGRGVFIRGNHAEKSDLVSRERNYIKRNPTYRILFDFPKFTLQKSVFKLFNTLYFHMNQIKKNRRIMSCDSFFYPLDFLGSWNCLYGKNGFFQYQCVIPAGYERESAHLLLDGIRRSGLGSSLAVMKMFGDISSPGIMSFPRKGLTLTFDFSNDGKKTLALMDELDKVICGCGGAVYPAKDARMSASSFKTYFPRWKEFSHYIDPKFSSSFWRRVASVEPGGST